MWLTRRPSWLIFVTVMAIPLLYAAYTGHTWEDFFINYRVSTNLARGNDLVYTPGERVQVFTIPFPYSSRARSFLLRAMAPKCSCSGCFG